MRENLPVKFVHAEKYALKEQILQNFRNTLRGSSNIIASKRVWAGRQQMEIGLAWAFWGVSMLFVLTPGADWAYAISSGVRQRAAVLPAVSGMLMGHICAVLLVAAGVAAVVSASHLAMTCLTMVGAMYLIVLGIQALRNLADSPVHAEGTLPGRNKLFAKGVGISLLNPKVMLLFLALLPQFASAEASWSIGRQIVSLGAVHVANCALVYFAVGYGANTVLSRKPRAARRVTITSGIVMIALGALLVVEKVVSAVNG
ncbi:LysE family translocator [Glutamicibacter sp. NPDC087344]|uniref:LysE family translocator n=1 Tax=Glutamicibacter sp. NPDC087344 TaxID=3363994 RepID=UPI0037FBFB06